MGLMSERKREKESVLTFDTNQFGLEEVGDMRPGCPWDNPMPRIFAWSAILTTTEVASQRLELASQMTGDLQFVSAISRPCAIAFT